MPASLADRPRRPRDAQWRAIGGPGAKLHNPLMEAALWVRNVESLRRLRKLAERH